MKFKLQNILLITLLVTNVIMLFMLVKQPHRSQKRAGSFLMEQLEFDKSQEQKFLHLDRIHRDKMMGFDDEIQIIKNKIFEKTVDKEEFDINYYSSQIGILEGKKEVEIFHFFNEIRSFISSDQEDKLNKILEQIINNKNKGRRPMPSHGERPPHPPR